MNEREDSLRALRALRALFQPSATAAKVIPKTSPGACVMRLNKPRTTRITRKSGW